jgi:gliding motility-associated-like protein
LDLRVTVAVGNCTAFAQHTVESIMCNIPRGISPDNDGQNDSFDLTGMDVNKITIFNRYGLEVWQYNGNYTNQWHGQDSKNNELPTGTYFYSITRAGGKTVTGWVYINKKN